MDAESLSQVERVVTSATEALRQSTEATATALRQDMADLRQSTESTTTALRQDMAQLRQSTESTATALRQDMVELRQFTESTATDLRQDIGDVKRHTGVLVEGLRHDIQMVSEGFQLHLEKRHREDREYMEQEFREMRALMKLSYTQLHDRVEGLDHRVNRIEEHLGFSN